MKVNLANALAGATIAIAMIRAGIEIQRGEPAELGQPWWTFFIAAVAYALVGIWALSNEQRWIVIGLCALPFLFALFHLSDLRAGNPTVWITLVVSATAVVAQIVGS